MNFFKRRKILKKANFLDLRPVRVLGHEMRDDGGITLLMPRFKNRVNSALFQPPSKEKFIYIKLDRFGGQTWLLIDGDSTVAKICSGLNSQFPEELKPPEETEERVTNFLSLLYQQRYITFREIQNETEHQAKYFATFDVIQQTNSLHHNILTNQIMSKEILQLDPKALWKNFYSLTQIPRPSKKEDQIREFIFNFGKNLGLETIEDEVGNVIIRKPATPGMENRKGVVLQGHLDMVPQKNSDKVHDFEKDPIETVVDGEWVRANGTTLGADNGMGVAAAMAVLESKDLQHGPIEALFTSDEETGMTGATGLKAGVLKGDILVNMDSEDEGELYIGCAGGTNGNITFTYEEKALTGDYTGYKINITGLKGGHSGVDIHLGRGNANKIMNRVLHHCFKKHGLQVASIDGGSLRNAIPRESFAHVAIPSGNVDSFLKCLDKQTAKIKNELAAVEPTMKIEAVPAAVPASVIDPAVLVKFMNAIYACPNGVMRMSNEMTGLVETSNNLAIVKAEKGTIKISNLLRSSVDSAKADLQQMMQSVFDLAGADSVFDGSYPGWKPNPDSPILKTMQDVYNNKYGNIPEIKAIHAGLECGILGGAYPNWDMISFGPTIRFPHSPDEKVNIATVVKFYDFLVETLKNIPVK